MVWRKVVLSIALLFIIRFNNAAKNVLKVITPDFEKPLQLVCVNNPSQYEFVEHYIEYDSAMRTNSHTFNNSIMEKFKEMVGDNDKIILFIVGNGDSISYLSGNSFQAARNQTIAYKATSCVATYNYLQFANPFVAYFETLKHRIPIVIDILAAFFKAILLSVHFSIKVLERVFLSGFCLGGHIASMLGHRLQLILPGLPRAVWAFDPPKYGFPVARAKNGGLVSIIGKPRRAQKGDASIVLVFHTSKMGVREFMAGIDVVVNDGQNQPNCRLGASNTLCSHIAGLILRELCTPNGVKEHEKCTNLSGIVRDENGFPLAFKTKECAEHPKEGCIKFPIKFTDPPIGHDGVYYMHTGPVFETPKEKTLLRNLQFWT